MYLCAVHKFVRKPLLPMLLLSCGRVRAHKGRENVRGIEDMEMQGKRKHNKSWSAKIFSFRSGF